MLDTDTHVAVIGGGVVGCAVAHALARRGVEVVLLEAELGLALGASGSNSGILHTGFDSTPGELETRLILRSVALREELLDELGVTVWRCGARLAPGDEEERAAVARLAENARANDVEVRLDEDGSLTVPGETVSDPVAYVHALAGAAQAGGATIVLGARVTGLAAAGGTGGRAANDAAAGAPRDGLVVTLDTGEQLRVCAAVNCAGLYADELARSGGDEMPDVYPRKGEFLVFEAPQDAPLEQILLPVPSALGKGVLVFPTLDRRAVIAGPTAREREDKRDRSVEADAAELILTKARGMYPALEGLEPIGSYAGLRTAGRDANYVIERSRTLPALVHVAAIRSTGLSASLGIGEHVVAMLAEAGAISPGDVRALPTPAPAASSDHWWERAARGSQASPATSELAGPPGSR
jgi:glycerol-3-phosphate dehydrogenase